MNPTNPNTPPTFCALAERWAARVAAEVARPAVSRLCIDGQDHDWWDEAQHHPAHGWIVRCSRCGRTVRVNPPEAMP